MRTLGCKYPPHISPGDRLRKRFLVSRGFYLPSEEFGKSTDILRVYAKERHIMSIITEEDLQLKPTDFLSWRKNHEVCRFKGTHWYAHEDEWLYIIINEEWAVGDRYYHWNDEIAKHDDPEGYGGNLDWDICNSCIERSDLIDVLPFHHHADIKDASSEVGGPCGRPPYSDDWHLGARHFMNLVHDHMYALNDYEDQDEWEARVHGTWMEQADAFLTQQYKKYGDHIPSGEYTCDVCGIVLNDRRRSQ